MTVRLVFITIILFVNLAGTTLAETSWIAECLHLIVRDTKRRNCWPKPFDAPERYAVRAPFAVMVSNGWRRQNMLSDHHFGVENGDLTDAGRLKIRWILVEAPQQHRVIYVHTGDTGAVTAARIDKVRQAVIQIMPDGPLPPVFETSIPDRGWSASRVDQVGRKFEASIPDPRLPSASTDGGAAN